MLPASRVDGNKYSSREIFDDSKEPRVDCRKVESRTAQVRANNIVRRPRLSQTWRIGVARCPSPKIMVILVMVAVRHKIIAEVSTRVFAERPHAHDLSRLCVRLMLVAYDFTFRRLQRGSSVSRIK